ncbi:hypothetical protein AHAS_Ahas02G0144700 [Arachis hypogaea]
MVVYHNDGIIQNTHEGMSFACKNSFLFVIPCTMTLILCRSLTNQVCSVCSIFTDRLKCNS